MTVQISQTESMMAFLDKMGLPYSVEHCQSGSRYLVTKIGNKSIRLRFSDHGNIAKGATYPDVNVAPGLSTVDDAIEKVVEVLKDGLKSTTTQP